jgi:hypothetical protein
MQPNPTASQTRQPFVPNARQPWESALGYRERMRSERRNPDSVARQTHAAHRASFVFAR